MTPDNVSQARLLYDLIVLIGVVGNSILIWRKLNGSSEAREISPNPLMVQEATRYVTREDFLVQQQAVLDRLNRIDLTIGAMQSDRSIDLERLRTELRGDITRLHERIDDLPDRIIATLKNTGAIT